MISESQRDKLTSLTVELLLTIRAQHLRAGGNVLKHWSAIQERLRAAARTCVNVEEAVTKLARDLQIVDLGKDGSRALSDLAECARDCGRASEWLNLVEAEHGYIMALTRLAAEQRKEDAKSRSGSGINWLEDQEK